MVTLVLNELLFRSYIQIDVSYRNGSKVLQPTPIRSPVADEVKLEELDLHWLVEGEVAQGGSFADCVNQPILHQGFPRAVLVVSPPDPEILGRPGNGVSLSPQVLDLTASNHPCAVVHFHGEALSGCLALFCQPKVELVIAQKGIFFTQDEDVACWVDAVDGSALNHLWSQRTSTI